MTGHSRSEATALKDQQGRIKDLMLDQRENEIRIRYLEIAQARSEMEDGTITATRADSVLDNASIFTAPVHSPKAEMREYYRLIKTILSDIDACKVHLERHRYRRIRDGVWMLHMEENDTFDASLVQSLKPNFPDLIPGGYVFLFLLKFGCATMEKDNADNVQKSTYA